MRRYLLLLIPLAVVAAVAVSVGRGSSDGEQVLDGPPPERYQVRLSGAAITVEAEGTVRPASRAELAFPIAGRVAEVLVDVGDSVSTGQALIRLDDEALRLDVVAAEAGLEPARGALRAARAELDAALDEASPEKIEQAAQAVDLAKDALWTSLAERDALCAADNTADNNEAVPTAECAEAETAVRHGEVDVQLAERALVRLTEGPTKAEVEAARESVALAEARLAAAEAEADKARLRVDDATLDAPFDGTVTSIATTPGAVLTAGQIVVGVADLDRLQVELMIDEKRIALVEPGRPVHVRIDALPFHRIEGRIRTVAPAPAMDPPSGADSDPDLALSSGSESSSDPPAAAPGSDPPSDAPAAAPGHGEDTSATADLTDPADSADTADSADYAVLVAVDAAGAPLRPGMSAAVTIFTSLERPTITIPVRAVRSGAVADRDSGAEAGTGRRTTVEIIARNALPRAARGATAFAGFGVFGGFGGDGSGSSSGSSSGSGSGFGDFDADADADAAPDADTALDAAPDTAYDADAGATARPVPAPAWPWGGPWSGQSGGQWDWRAGFAELPTLDELGSQLDGLPTRLVEVKLGPVDGTEVTVLEGLWHGDIIVMPPDDGAAGGR